MGHLTVTPTSVPGSFKQIGVWQSRYSPCEKRIDCGSRHTLPNLTQPIPYKMKVLTEPADCSHLVRSMTVLEQSCTLHRPHDTLNPPDCEWLRLSPSSLLHPPTLGRAAPLVAVAALRGTVLEDSPHSVPFEFCFKDCPDWVLHEREDSNVTHGEDQRRAVRGLNQDYFL